MSVQAPAPAPAASLLYFNNRRVIPLHRLPFIGPVRGRTQFSFWAVPRTGGYAGGNDVDMIDPAAAGSLTPEQAALRGQVVGFFSELDAWLEVAAYNLEGGLDAQSDKALLALVNAGLRLDEHGEEGES